MGSRLEVKVQVLGEVPAEREITVPEELLVEGQRQSLVISTLQVALLQFIVATGDLRVEGDVLRQIVQSECFREVEPFDLPFSRLKGSQVLYDGE